MRSTDITHVGEFELEIESNLYSFSLDPEYVTIRQLQEISNYGYTITIDNGHIHAEGDRKAAAKMLMDAALFDAMKIGYLAEIAEVRYLDWTDFADAIDCAVEPTFLEAIAYIANNWMLTYEEGNNLARHRWEESQHFYH